MKPNYSSYPGGKLIRMPRWAAALLLIAAVLLGLILIILAAGLALIIIPAAFSLGMILRQRLRRTTGKAPRQGDIIDVECGIVDRKR
ncbi:hypothetical protein [Microvirga sp. BSC39]|jgi:hypothetical protein|uniref:hypothetical protein n=1 Tax=Microvirga sp. BSC39 TaxID=1549810 RepID=UPI001269B02F|nr:hypothetical protein [Microvirga sp. BSC39]